MNKFPMLVFAFGLPLLGFLVLKDGSKTLYMSKSDGLSYQIIDPEDVAVEEEVTEPVVEEDVAEAEVEVAEPEVPAQDDATAEVVPEPVEEPVQESADPVAALSAKEMADGKKAIRACSSCHQLERERNAVGPHLVGISGRAIGSVEGFKYSGALKALNEEGLVWTQANLEQWLADPTAFAKGTKMNFKVGNEEKRRLIAGYLAAQ